MLFSSTLVVRYKVRIKQKLQRHNNAGVLGGRGWITRAALLKQPAGLFCAVFGDSAAAVLIHPLCPTENCAKQKFNALSYVELFLVGAGGFEPPKLKAADLQSVPIGHSGTRPYSFACPAGRLVYFSMEGWICQHFSANFCRHFSKPGSGQKARRGPEKGHPTGLGSTCFFLTDL